jgi:hypothetical protein
MHNPIKNILFTKLSFFPLYFDAVTANIKTPYFTLKQ